MKKRLVFLGPPGSGKDTQGKMISEELNIPHISSGDMIRKEINDGTPFGMKFKELTESGALVPNNFMNDFFKHKLDDFVLANGFILNGFPRTVPQAEFLNEYLKKVNALIELVIFFEVPTDILIKRLSGRRICPKCHAVYNVYFSPPKVDGICDNCNEKLIIRKDDEEEAVKKRIEVYFNETLPLVDFYTRLGLLKSLDASLPVLDVKERLLGELNDCN